MLQALANVSISQAKHFKCGGMITIANLLLSVPVKEFWKSVCINWCSYDKKLMA